MIKLALTFMVLSVLAIGGGSALISEMQHVLNETYGISPAEFMKIYSIGQLAPGPNMTMVLVLGAEIGGGLGALVVGLAFFGPSSLLCFWMGRLWHRIGETPWRRAVQSAFEPVSIGLMCAGAYALGETAVQGPLTALLAVAAGVIVATTRLNPVFAILGLALAGGTISNLLPAWH